MQVVSDLSLSECLSVCVNECGWTERPVNRAIMQISGTLT